MAGQSVPCRPVRRPPLGHALRIELPGQIRQRNRPQPRDQQRLRLAQRIVQRRIDHALHRALGVVAAVAYGKQVRPAHGVVDVEQRDLRQIARYRRRRGAVGETLSTTALVNEAYLKFAASPELFDHIDRNHFLALAAQIVPIVRNAGVTANSTSATWTLSAPGRCCARSS